MSLSPSEFHTRSAQALDHVDEHLGGLEHDALDVDLAGDVLTLSFEDGGTFILNAHSAAGQMWLAANIPWPLTGSPRPTTAWGPESREDRRARPPWPLVVRPGEAIEL